MKITRNMPEKFIGRGNFIAGTVTRILRPAIYKNVFFLGTKFLSLRRFTNWNYAHRKNEHYTEQ